MNDVDCMACIANLAAGLESWWGTSDCIATRDGVTHARLPGTDLACRWIRVIDDTRTSWRYVGADS